MDAIFRALGEAAPEAVPASSGGDIARLVWWGRHPDGEPWADGSPHPVGQGAHARGDGAHAVMHVSEASTRIAPAEVWESRNPWLVERAELAIDSGGAGEHRGGNGLDLDIRLLEDAEVTSVVDRTTDAARGLGRRRRGAAERRVPAPRRRERIECAKATRLADAGRQRVRAADRRRRRLRRPAHGVTRRAVAADVREGYVSEEARRARLPARLRRRD